MLNWIKRSAPEPTPVYAKLDAYGMAQLTATSAHSAVAVTAAQLPPESVAVGGGAILDFVVGYALGRTILSIKLQGHAMSDEWRDSLPTPVIHAFRQKFGTSLNALESGFRSLMGQGMLLGLAGVTVAGNDDALRAAIGFSDPDALAARANMQRYCSENLNLAKADINAIAEAVEEIQRRLHAAQGS